MRAFHKVRFYRTDVQGTADSLVFSTVDSCLTMYRDPIIWNKNQQLLGEVIKVYMNDSTIDWSHIIGQALSVERVDSTIYNQVTGKEMKSYFTNGEMRKTEVIGSVRVVYYPMDSDSTLIGMNVSETSKLEIYLQDRKIERMVMSPSPMVCCIRCRRFLLEKTVWRILCGLITFVRSIKPISLIGGKNGWKTS